MTKKIPRDRLKDRGGLLRAPGMVDNLVVKVHYGLGSRNR